MTAAEEDRPGPSGRVIRGPVAATLPTERAASSIPAKFETVLYKGPRERKGFGSESRRFGDLDHDLPGPGSYDRASTMEFQHDSIGRKGFGSMVSKNQRFKERIRYTGPGPGEYKQAALSKTGDFNCAATSAAFQSAITAPRRQLESAEVGGTPGPGAYCANETRTGDRLGVDNAPGARSAFKGTPHKLALMGNPDAPPPNAYQMADLWEGKAYRGGGGSTSSSFAPRSISHSQAAHSIVFEEAGASGQKPSETGPGPGAYDTQEFGSIRAAATKAAVRMSAAFTPLGCVDGTGRPPQPARAVQAGPGPGQYFSEPPAVSLNGAPRPGVSAPFVSRSPGRAKVTHAASTDVPGPAYYTKTDPPPGRKSFHLNARSRYVTRA